MIFNSTDEYIQEQIKRSIEFASQSTKESVRGSFLAASTTHSEMIERIFDDGLDSSENVISSYSTKAAYIKSPNKSESKYYEGGYAEFKKSRSKSKAAQSGNWDLTLTSELRLEFTNGVEYGEGIWSYGVTNNADKVEWLEEKSGKIIFTHSDTERNKYAKRVERNLIIYLNGQ